MTPMTPAAQSLARTSAAAEASADLALAVAYLDRARARLAREGVYFGAAVTRLREADEAVRTTLWILAQVPGEMEQP